MRESKGKEGKIENPRIVQPRKGSSWGEESALVMGLSIWDIPKHDGKLVREKNVPHHRRKASLAL